MHIKDVVMGEAEAVGAISLAEDADVDAVVTNSVNAHQVASIATHMEIAPTPVLSVRREDQSIIPTLLLQIGWVVAITDVSGKNDMGGIQIVMLIIITSVYSPHLLAHKINKHCMAYRIRRPPIIILIMILYIYAVISNLRILQR